MFHGEKVGAWETWDLDDWQSTPIGSIECLLIVRRSSNSEIRRSGISSQQVSIRQTPSVTMVRLLIGKSLPPSDTRRGYCGTQCVSVQGLLSLFQKMVLTRVYRGVKCAPERTAQFPSLWDSTWSRDFGSVYIDQGKVTSPVLPEFWLRITEYRATGGLISFYFRVLIVDRSHQVEIIRLLEGYSSVFLLWKSWSAAPLTDADNSCGREVVSATQGHISICLAFHSPRGFIFLNFPGTDTGRDMTVWKSFRK
jgi:hypothetical protein